MQMFVVICQTAFFIQMGYLTLFWTRSGIKCSYFEIHKKSGSKMRSFILNNSFLFEVEKLDRI